MQIFTSDPWVVGDFATNIGNLLGRSNTSMLFECNIFKDGEIIIRPGDVDENGDRRSRPLSVYVPLSHQQSGTSFFGYNCLNTDMSLCTDVAFTSGNYPNAYICPWSEESIAFFESGANGWTYPTVESIDRFIWPGSVIGFDGRTDTQHFHDFTTCQEWAFEPRHIPRDAEPCCVPICSDSSANPIKTIKIYRDTNPRIYRLWELPDDLSNLIPIYGAPNFIGGPPVLMAYREKFDYNIIGSVRRYYGCV